MMEGRRFMGDILTGVLVVARLRPPQDSESFRSDIRGMLEALASRPGHVSSRLARALDDPRMWVLVSEWMNVGSYRRALSSYNVKMASGALMGAAVNEPSAYEVVEQFPLAAADERDLS
jgi:quinol monooxygenase YgiN